MPQQQSLTNDEDTPAVEIRRLCDLEPDEAADCFVLLERKERSKTRDGKPYYRAVFRDAGRSATAMIWNDTVWFSDCENTWREGGFYKLRCRYFENQFGPQIELERIREVTETDAADGFDANAFYESSAFAIEEMFQELRRLAQNEIDEPGLRRLVQELLEEHGEEIRRMPAATRNHHAFIGGYLEHVLSVTRTALFLAEKYAAYYRQMDPPLSKALVVAGAVLHDIGKLLELSYRPQGATYTAEGRLIGHILLGRDLIREKAASIAELDPEQALRLEHILVAHQNRPEWGSPIPPHTPEALLVHYADEIDAKFHMMASALTDADQPEEMFTGADNPMRRRIFRGLGDDPPET